jgi:acyl carrier protein
MVRWQSMKERVMEIISSYADIDTRKIDIDMTFEELNLDYDDVMELLIPIEEEFSAQNLAEVFRNVTVDTTISRFIEILKDNL